ncbi:MAG: hypothetical protein Q9174_005488 [Haloplaca sp. 1 TL-2023]
MLPRRNPTAITLTSEDVVAYEDSRAARAQSIAENNKNKKDAKADPNDELKPLPSDKAKNGRTGPSREERIGVNR